MSTPQERAVARAEALATAERVGAEAGRIAVELQRDLETHLHPDERLARTARALATQVAALAGAVESLATAV